MPFWALVPTVLSRDVQAAAIAQLRSPALEHLWIAKGADCRAFRQRKQKS